LRVKPNDPKPRQANAGQPSKPEIAELDRTPWSAEKQRRFDQPKRRLTDPGLPAPPHAPREYAATLPAPSTTAATLRATPASGQEAARIEDAPQSRSEAREALLESELAKQRAKVAELERQARVRTESQGPGPYQAPIVAPERPSVAPQSVAGEGSTRALRSALTKLTLAFAALLAILGIPLTAYIQAITTKVERSTSVAAQANARADAVEAKSETKIKAQVDSANEFRQYRANRRELDRLQGIEYPKVEGDPNPHDLEPYAPLCAPGKVCPGPQLILRKAP
jgi:hypothetical protein